MNTLQSKWKIGHWVGQTEARICWLHRNPFQSAPTWGCNQWDQWVVHDEFWAIYRKITYQWNLHKKRNWMIYHSPINIFIFMSKFLSLFWATGYNKFFASLDVGLGLLKTLKSWEVGRSYWCFSKPYLMLKVIQVQNHFCPLTSSSLRDEGEAHLWILFWVWSLSFHILAMLSQQHQ